jgi:hypothetical protein
MTAPIWAGLVLLAFGLAATLLPRLSPERRWAALVFAGAAALAAVRLFPLALALATLGLGLWRRGSAPPGPGGRSEVESAGLRMTLDHASGVMDGEVTSGPERGARLSRLSAAELQALAARFEAEGDEDSLALLLAWMERHRRPRDAAQPPSGAAMTEAEAYRVLGLPQGASVEEVRAAYHRLMRRVHPDLGGSSALAALLNAAKERLDPS